MAQTFPARGVDICTALYNASPQDEAARREDIQKVGEQMCFELGPRWGNKKRSGLGDEFRSPDSLAYLEDDQTISIWDIQTSAGVLTVFDGKPPDYPNVSQGDADFMVCQPVNHLAMPEPPEPGEPGAPLPPTDLTPILEALAQLSQEVAAQAAQIATLNDTVERIRTQGYDGEARFGVNMRYHMFPTAGK